MASPVKTAGCGGAARCCALPLLLSALSALLVFPRASAVTPFAFRVSWATMNSYPEAGVPFSGFVAQITYAPSGRLFFTFDKDGKSEPAFATPVDLIENVTKFVNMGRCAPGSGYKLVGGLCRACWVDPCLMRTEK